MTPRKTFPSLLPWLVCAAVFLIGGTGAARGEMAFPGQGSGGESGRLVFPTKDLRTMTPVPFTLEVFNGGGGNIRGARVSCDLTMPAMRMPDNRPAVAPEGDLYRGEAIFTMAGAWRLSCRIVSPDGSESALVFDIPEVRLK